MCLSLGIGTNTTVFTFVNALLLQPLPLAYQADRRRDAAAVRAISVAARAERVTMRPRGCRSAGGGPQTNALILGLPGT
jgi:hypothetical protein